MSHDSDEGEQGLAWDKRARATAIVKAYLTRTAKYNEDYKSLALNGVMTMPAAMVDPTGLLGMALAFRAAAGVLNMPDDSEEQITKSTRPWAAIDTTSAKTSAERTENLEKQIKMLEKEIKRVTANTAKRRELTEMAVAQRVSMDQKIESDDIAARFNHFKKKKKFLPRPVDSSGKTPEAGDYKGEGVELEDELPEDSMLEAEEDVSNQDKPDAVVMAEPLPEDDEEDEDDSAPVSEVVVAAMAEDDE
jgi:hypothetical protein